MDEPQPTQNLFRPQEPREPYDDQTQMLGHAGPPPEQEYYGPLPGPAPQPTMAVGPIGPPPGWPQPIWRRRGALIGAGLLVLVIAGLIVGIVLAVPGSPATPSNTAASVPATSTAPAAGHAHRTPHLGPGESLVQGTVGSVTGDQLVVTPAKGGNPVTVTTDGSTRFAGGASSITDLTPGEHVSLIVRNGTAVAVRARKAPSGG